MDQKSSGRGNPGKSVSMVLMALVVLLVGYVLIFNAKSPFNVVFNRAKFKYTDRMQVAYDYIYAENYKGSIPVLEEAIKLKPNKAEAHDLLGYSFYKTGQVDRAVFEFETAVKLDPKYHKSYANLAAVFMKKAQDGIDTKDYATARLHLSRAAKEIGTALEIMPKEPRYLDMQKQIVDTQIKMPK